MTLEQYFLDTKKRLSVKAIEVLGVLNHSEGLNKEELSLAAGVKRSVLDKLLLQLYALGFADIRSINRGQVAEITELGRRFYQL